MSCIILGGPFACLNKNVHTISQTHLHNIRGKQPTSERKILANRQNALRSTGPKTFQGKSNSRKNSLKHGFYAQDLRTAFPLGIEDPRDFQKMHADLRNEWQPVGVSEESEVEQIAVSYVEA